MEESERFHTEVTMSDQNNELSDKAVTSATEAKQEDSTAVTILADLTNDNTHEAP